MNKAHHHSNKTMIIVITVMTLLVGLSMYGLVKAFQNFQTNSAKNAAERREILQKMMPQAPEGYELVKEGYDPQANCFDSCGYEFQHYRYPNEATVCADVISAIQRDPRSLSTVNEREEAVDVAMCNEDLARRRQDKSLFSTSFYVSALMTHTVNDRPVTRETKFTRISIDPKAQEVIYRVSQEYEYFSFTSSP